MPTDSGEGYALVVGINEYQRMTPLSKAVTDAEEVAEVLVHHHGYPRDQVILLTDADATVGALRDAFNWLARTTTASDTVVVYFAGHGLRRVIEPDAGEYLCCWEADRAKLRSTAMSISDLNESLEKIAAGRVAVFLDACHAGGWKLDGEARDTGESDRVSLTRNTYGELSKGRGRFLLAACTEDQKSVELSDHGLFTHCLLERLCPKAGAVGEVTVSGLAEYVTHEVQNHPENKGGVQTPWSSSAMVNFTITAPTPTEPLLPWVQGLHLDFTNRHDEIDTIVASDAPPYYFVYGPAGYGKTDLLQLGLKPRFAAKRWKCVYIPVVTDDSEQKGAEAAAKESTTVGSGLAVERLEQKVAEATAKELKVELVSSVALPLSYGQRLSRGIVNASWRPVKGLALLFDLDKEPNLAVLQWMVKSYIPDIYKDLKRDSGRRFLTQSSQFLRVVIAGRHLAGLPEPALGEAVFNPLACKPFAYDTIRGATEAHLKKQNPDELPLIAAHLLHLSGGHPGCIAQILEQCDQGDWSPDDLLGQATRIWRSYVRRVLPELFDGVSSRTPGTSGELLTQISAFRKYGSMLGEPGKAVPWFRVRELLTQMSVFRLLGVTQCRYFAEVYAKDLGIGDGAKLYDRLAETRLFTQDGEVLRDDISRRLRVIHLRQKSPAIFVELCKAAKDLALQSLKDPDTDGSPIWVLEYLFQMLQGYTGSRADLESCWDAAVREALDAYFGRSKNPYSRIPKRNALVQLIMHKGEWEFQFTLNYYLRGKVYDSELYKGLVQKVKDHS